MSFFRARLSIMSVVTSRLSNDQKKKLLSLLGHVQMHLLYKASVHGFTGGAFHARCDIQGPTVAVAYNSTGFVFGAYISQDFAQSGQEVKDEAAFVYSVSEADSPHRVRVTNGQCAFTDVHSGPNYGALVFLHEDKPEFQSNPGTNFNFKPDQIHGGDLSLTEFEVYRVEGL